MVWRWAALLALPFVAVALWTRLQLAPRWGDVIARKLGDVAALLASAPPAPPPPIIDSGEVAALLDGLDGGAPVAVVTDAGVAKGSSAKAARDGGAAPASGTVRVPAWAVEKAIEDGGKNIRGRTVRDAAGRPAGVRLTGVTSAHVGLQDGDVVIAIDGKPTPTDDDATEVALNAIGRGDGSLRATVTRGAQVFDVVLDLPGPGPSADGGAGKAQDAGKKAR